MLSLFKKKAPSFKEPTSTVYCSLFWINTNASPEAESTLSQDFSWSMPTPEAESWAHQLISGRHAIRINPITGNSIAEAHLQYPGFPWQEVCCDIWIEPNEDI